MIVTLCHHVKVSSIQKATALRDRQAAVIEEDKDAKLLNSSMNKATRAFNVVGVDVNSKQPFTERVDAVDEAEAKTQVESKSKVVAAVEPNGA